MSWYDNIKEWTSLRYEQATRIAMDREMWRVLCHPTSKDKEHEKEEEVKNSPLLAAKKNMKLRGF